MQGIYCNHLLMGMNDYDHIYRYIYSISAIVTVTYTYCIPTDYCYNILLQSVALASMKFSINRISLKPHHDQKINLHITLAIDSSIQVW